MRSTALKLAALALVAGLPLSVSAATVDGGLTSVLPGNGALASVGLQVAGITGDTVAPAELGPFSVGFSIDPASTFSYSADDFLGTFSGTIEHSGGIELTDTATQSASITVGDFTIGFDAGRIVGDASGFFVQDTLDTGAILFDIGSPLVEAFDTSLVISGNLLISEEFNGLLNQLGLVDIDVTGVDAGLALVNASAVPVPGAGLLLFGALGGLGLVRRRG